MKQRVNNNRQKFPHEVYTTRTTIDEGWRPWILKTNSSKLSDTPLMKAASLSACRIGLESVGDRRAAALIGKEILHGNWDEKAVSHGAVRSLTLRQ